MHIYQAYFPDVHGKMGKVRYVVGKVEGPLDLEADEKVLFAGDCTSWKGKIGDEEVHIKSRYKAPTDVDEQKTKSNDMLLKTLKTLMAAYRRRNSRYVRAKGCTLSVGDHVHYLSVLGRIKNVNFDPGIIFSLNAMYWVMRVNRLLNRFLP
jgi:hypothetical protein